MIKINVLNCYLLDFSFIWDTIFLWYIRIKYSWDGVILPSIFQNIHQGAIEIYIPFQYFFPVPLVGYYHSNCVQIKYKVIRRYNMMYRFNLKFWVHNYLILHFCKFLCSLRYNLFNPVVKQNECCWPRYIFYFSLYPIAISFAKLLVEGIYIYKFGNLYIFVCFLV